MAEQPDAATWIWDEPTLVVVDYAGLLAPLLHNWLGQLTDYAPTDLPRLRILLLERHADPASGISAGEKSRYIRTHGLAAYQRLRWNSPRLVGGRLVDAGCSASSTIGYSAARHPP